MSGVARCYLLGNVGAEPEVRALDGDRAVCNFQVAVNKRWAGKDGQQTEKTNWFRVSAWGKLGEICGQHLRRGSQVWVEGDLKVRGYEKDGQKREVTEITAREVKFLGKRQAAEPMGQGGYPEPGSDDHPF